MDGLLTLLLVFEGSALVACPYSPLRQYTLVNINMTWPEAQQYCRQHYSDLATFENEQQLQSAPEIPGDSWAWIGMFDDPSSWKGVMGNEPNSWRWSDTGRTRPGGFQAWAADEPNYFYTHETCVMMADNGEWQDKPCGALSGFICFTDSDSSARSYEYISTNSTWADAQAYCREHHTDLAVIESSTQNADAISAKPSGFAAWIGLYRVPWVWSDQSLSSFRNWIEYSPNYPSLQHCAAQGPDGTWDDDYCTIRYYLALCQTDVSRHQSTMRVIMATEADIAQDVNNAQILQKAEEVLKSHGYTDVKLSWKVRPVKQPPKQQAPQPQCDDL